MTTNLRRLLALFATLALCLPAAAPARAKHVKHHRPAARTAVLHGSVSAVHAARHTVVVHVTRANRPGRAVVGRNVNVVVTGTSLRVADANGDGARSARDVAKGDRVLVTVHLSRGARQHALRFVDVTSKPHAADDGADGASVAPGDEGVQSDDPAADDGTEGIDPSDDSADGSDTSDDTGDTGDSGDPGIPGDDVIGPDPGPTPLPPETLVN